jgi:hypothetical protein
MESGETTFVDEIIVKQGKMMLDNKKTINFFKHVSVMSF